MKHGRDDPHFVGYLERNTWCRYHLTLLNAAFSALAIFRRQFSVICQVGIEDILFELSRLAN
jgi:hypothetical protein